MFAKIRWVCKVQSLGKHKNGWVKKKYSLGSGETKFPLGRGKKSTGSGSTGSVTEGCYKRGHHSTIATIMTMKFAGFFKLFHFVIIHFFRFNLLGDEAHGGKTIFYNANSRLTRISRFTRLRYPFLRIWNKIHRHDLWASLPVIVIAQLVGLSLVSMATTPLCHS